ncbi:MULTISPECIES: hypothetical protein [unclassified Luteibacter]|uniref:hypothetical protein n=1 Tax=unclassified Luteibacter TaxID=2620188 RepID=UPI0005B80213|nr:MULTISPECIES: hypothetical protein [unclassified Luteibacter]MDR6644560.1 hypothetical protein [Luteibacter sp. 1214]
MTAAQDILNAGSTKGSNVSLTAGNEILGGADTGRVDLGGLKLGNTPDGNFASLTGGTSRVSHLSGRIHGQFAEDVAQLAVKKLLKGAESEDGSLRSLESHAYEMALYAWFADGDLVQSKAWVYTADRLHAKSRRPPRFE